MTRLDREPAVAALARELGLSGRGNCVEKIRTYALEEVRDHLEAWPVPVSSPGDLQRVLCDRLSLKLEYVLEDGDLFRVAEEYRFPEPLKRQLFAEFRDEGTEGWLVLHPDPQPGDRRYVAVVDARGDRAVRAYFTGWHEVTHLIVTPVQLMFDGFRRAIPVDKKKDPVESVVDVVTGDLAFYEPFVRPVLQELLEREGGLTFGVVEEMRQRVAPDASLYAAAIGAVKLVEDPTLLVRPALAYKRSARRRLRSRQEELDLGVPAPEIVAKLRVVDVIPGGDPSSVGLRIFQNMRVPEDSVLHRTFESKEDVALQAEEDQSWWETSTDGFLPDLPIHVEAVRKGEFMYGLISPL